VQLRRPTRPYGFRPGRGQHQALEEVGRVLCTRPMGWVLEIDIRSYFDSIVRSALVEMIEKRVTDGSVLRLIGKWIKVGVIEDGRLLVSETGTGQGQPISPLQMSTCIMFSIRWHRRRIGSRTLPLLAGASLRPRNLQHKEDAEKALVAGFSPRFFAFLAATRRNLPGPTEISVDIRSPEEGVGLAHYCPVKELGRPYNPQLLQDLAAILAFFDLNSSEPIFALAAARNNGP
jgi:hypothetical protein